MALKYFHAPNDPRKPVWVMAGQPHTPEAGGRRYRGIGEDRAVKITRIETAISSAFRGFTWVQVYTDDGLIGTGETTSGHDAVTGYVHEEAAQFLLGQDPIAIERHFATLSKVNHLGGMGHRAIGAEMRGLSAIDIALWDIFGQSVGLPIYRLLGGPVRDRIRLYNTCCGYTGIGYDLGHAISGPYEDDYEGWHEGRAGEIATSLLDMGITAMKIWPFEKFADTQIQPHRRPLLGTAHHARPR